jgi:hypothetical protein
MSILLKLVNKMKQKLKLLFQIRFFIHLSSYIFKKKEKRH